MRLIPVNVLAIIMAGSNMRQAEGSAIVSWISEHNPFSGWSWGNGNQGQQGSASSSANLRKDGSSRYLSTRTGIKVVDQLLAPWRVEKCMGDLDTRVANPKTVLDRSLNTAKRETLMWWYAHKAVFQSILGRHATEYLTVEAHAKQALNQQSTLYSDHVKFSVLDAVEQLSLYTQGTFDGSCPVVTSNMIEILKDFSERYTTMIRRTLRQGGLRKQIDEAHDALNTAGNAVAGLETYQVIA